MVFVNWSRVSRRNRGIISAESGSICTIRRAEIKLRLPLNFVRAIATLAKVARNNEMATVTKTTTKLLRRLVEKPSLEKAF
jgi:hypothetical protein